MARILFLALACVLGLSAGGYCLAIEPSGDNYRDPFFHYLDKKGADSAKLDNKTAQPANETLSLEGLVWDSAMPQAIINGKIVKIGDKVDNAEVMDIAKAGVKIRRLGKEIVLTKKGGDGK